MLLDSNNPPETVEFNGTTFRRMGGKRRYYLGRVGGHPKGLHVAIWEFHSGVRVQAGHEVHHKDHNTFNCNFENLECLPRKLHRAMEKKNFDPVVRERSLRLAREAAVEWHKSDVGREWHRQHAFESIRKPGVNTHPVRCGACAWCGESFVGNSGKRKFCGAKCQNQESRWRLGKSAFVNPFYAQGT